MPDKVTLDDIRQAESAQEPNLDTEEVTDAPEIPDGDAEVDDSLQDADPDSPYAEDDYGDEDSPGDEESPDDNHPDADRRFAAMENTLGQLTQAVQQMGTYLQKVGPHQAGGQGAMPPPTPTRITLPEDFDDWSADKQARWVVGVNQSTIQNVHRQTDFRLQMLSEMLDTTFGNTLPEVLKSFDPRNPAKAVKILQREHSHVIEAINYALQNGRSFAEAYKLVKADSLNQQNSNLQKKVEHHNRQTMRQRDKARVQTRPPNLSKTKSQLNLGNLNLTQAIQQVDRELRTNGQPGKRR